MPEIKSYLLIPSTSCVHHLLPASRSCTHSYLFTSPLATPQQGPEGDHRSLIQAPQPQPEVGGIQCGGSWMEQSIPI